MKIILANQFKNEEKRIQEWILYHKSLGIKDFCLVNDYSTDKSIELIKSIHDVNVDILNSDCPELLYFKNSEMTEIYKGNVLLAHNIITNFKKIHNFCLNKYGENIIIGYFDVDEFIFSNSNYDVIETILKNIKDWPVLSLHSLEVDSTKFTLNSWVTLQTTKAMSEKSKFKSTRATTKKSFQNLSLRSLCNNFNYYNLEIGSYIHNGGVPEDKTYTIPINELAFLHYRNPVYDPEINIPLCDTEYPIVTKIAKKAYFEFYGI